jgi:hypothetical protein
LPRPIYQIICPKDSFRAGELVRSDFQNNPYPACGGRRPANPISVLPAFVQLVGKPTAWSYPDCDSNYTKKPTGSPEPYAYGCYKK